MSQDCDDLRVFAEEYAEREGMDFADAIRELARENGIWCDGKRARKSVEELAAIRCVRHYDGSIEEAHPWASREIAHMATEAQGISMQFPHTTNSHYARIIAEISATVPNVNAIAAYELREACASIIHAMCTNC